MGPEGRRIKGMYWLKACQKCHGDLCRDTDVYGTYLACLQCGSHTTEAEQVWSGLNTAEFRVQPITPAQLELLAA